MEAQIPENGTPVEEKAQVVNKEVFQTKNKNSKQQHVLEGCLWPETKCFTRFLKDFHGQKEGHVGASLGTFQQAHVAQTTVCTIFSVDVRGVTFAPQK